MLSVVLLVPLSMCYAQWPLQSIGYEDVKPMPRPFSQPGYPYDDARHIEEMLHNPNFELPDNANPILEDAMEETKFLNNPAASEAADTPKEQKTTVPLDALKFPVYSASSDVANIILETGSRVKDEVNNLLSEETSLRNSTDLFMNQLNLLYLNLAIDESDNEVKIENIYKYGMSLILRFLLEFYRIFRKLTSQSNQLQLTDAYRVSFDKAVDVMKEKREYTPLQIAAPVRRSAEIFKSIIYESVVIVQTKCSALDPNWKCVILYLANLISESLNCSNVWYHAFIHMLALETKSGIQDSFIYKIADLDKFKEFVYFENVFDFVIEKLHEYREVGRIDLSAEAVVFTMLADLQENGLLNCVSIDYLYN